MLLLQSFTICESLADFVTQLDIAMVNRVKDYQFHLLHIWITIFCQILLIHKNIDDFCHKIVACLAFIVFLLDATLQSHREICENRSAYHNCLLDVPSCLFHLLRVVFGRYDAYKIGCHPATIYEELRRGDTGKLDKNQRPEYDPRLAQRTFQEAIRRRGNRRTTATAESGQ